MLKILVVCVAVILTVGVLLDKNFTSLLAGLGASAAVLMLIFKDTILGLVAGVQLSAHDMLRPGDWIVMDKYGVNGTVEEVTLNTVKVRNWDNTVTTVPPYVLVSDSFKNWRGMRESQGRRRALPPHPGPGQHRPAHPRPPAGPHPGRPAGTVLLLHP